MPYKITHITTVHSRFDTRIFLKECCSLAASGYDVSLIVADGKENEYRDGVQILDVGAFSSRFFRILISPWRAFYVAMCCRPTIVHLHDPELLFIGVLFRLCGKRVIYDAHEDLPSQIKRKYWIPPMLRKPIGVLTKYILKLSLYFYNAVVTATDGIAESLPHTKVVSVKNYPILSEFENVDLSGKIEGQFCYVGGISEDRGLYTMLDSLPRDNAKLVLAGMFFPSSLEDEVRQHPKWEQIEYRGFLPRDEIAQLYASSVAGLVLLHSNKGFEDSLPIKLFEYMSSSLPIICSNFPLWQKIVDEYGCGFAVDPSDTEAIGSIMLKIITDPLAAREMGAKGRKAVMSNYNWSVEAEKIIALYSELI
jgi:glycosyltransferase involved in cell wall biosynthesis